MLSFFYPFLFLLFLANLSGHHAYCLQTADVFQVVFSLSSKQEPKNASAPRRLPCLLVQSWTKVLGHFRVYGAFHTGPTPPLTPQTMLDACIENFFFRVSTLYKVGGGRTARKFGMYCFKREPRNDRKI